MSGQNSFATLQSEFNITSISQRVCCPKFAGSVDGMCVRNAGHDGIAYDFGIIELKFATLGASDEDTAYGIHRAMPGVTSAKLEVARVLIEKHREYRVRLANGFLVLHHLPIMRVSFIRRYWSQVQLFLRKQPAPLSRPTH